MMVVVVHHYGELDYGDDNADEAADDGCCSYYSSVSSWTCSSSLSSLTPSSAPSTWQDLPMSAISAAAVVAVAAEPCHANRNDWARTHWHVPCSE